MNIKEAQEQIQQLADKLKAELDAPEWPQEGDYYWTISFIGGIGRFVFSAASPPQAFKRSIGWLFRTEAEAQKHLTVLQATERVKQYIAKANGDWVANFNDEDQQKATWEYNHKGGRFNKTTNQFIQKTDAWRYIKPELFDQLIEDCGDDIKLILWVEG